MASYLDEYKLLHKNLPSFGSGACIYMPEICLVIDYLKPKTVLDFGCGKGNLIKELVHRYPTIEFYGYDPAIPGRDVLTIEKADLVINTDVLEHIPENVLPGIVAKIASISDNAFLGLHHALAYTILPNGENAHCTVKPPQWYYALFSKYYESPYPLPGRKIELSAVITFTPSIDFLSAYHQIVFSSHNEALQRQITEQQQHIEALQKQTIEQQQAICAVAVQKKILPRWLGHLMTCFIPKKKNRQRFREKYVRGREMENSEKNTLVMSYNYERERGREGLLRCVFGSVKS